LIRQYANQSIPAPLSALIMDNDSYLESYQGLVQRITDCEAQTGTIVGFIKFHTLQQVWDTGPSHNQNRPTTRIRGNNLVRSTREGAECEGY